MGKRRDWFSSTLKKALTCQSNERKKKKSQNLTNCWGKQRSLHSASSGAANAVVVPAGNPPIVEVESTAAKDDHNRHEHSVALATVDAAVEQNAAGVCDLGGMDEEVAAIKIQTAFRGYLARQALRTMKAREKLKSLSDRQYTKRQSATALKYAQMKVHLQSEVPSTRARMLENNFGLLRQIQDVKKLNEPPKASAEDRSCVYYAKNKSILDPNDPRWSWSLLKEWMAAQPQTNRSPIDEQVNNGHVTVKSSAGLSISSQGNTNLQSPKVRKQTQLPYWQPPSTPSSGRLRQLSRRFSANAKNDESKSISSIQSELCRRHSCRGSSVGDDTSLLSCPAYTRGYMASTVASRAKSRSPSLLGRTPVKATGGSARRRLSFSSATAPAAGFPGHNMSTKMDAITTKDGVQTHNGMNS